MRVSNIKQDKNDEEEELEKEEEREESGRPWLMDGDTSFMQQHPASVSRGELQENLQKVEEDVSKQRPESTGFRCFRVLQSETLKERQQLHSAQVRTGGTARVDLFYQ